MAAMQRNPADFSQPPGEYAVHHLLTCVTVYRPLFLLTGSKSVHHQLVTITGCTEYFYVNMTKSPNVSILKEVI